MPGDETQHQVLFCYCAAVDLLATQDFLSSIGDDYLYRSFISQKSFIYEKTVIPFFNPSVIEFM
jgi:hypothetical protein